MSALTRAVAALFLLVWQGATNGESSQECTVERNLACAGFGATCTPIESVVYSGETCEGVSWIVRLQVGNSTGDVIGPLYKYFAVPPGQAPVHFEKYSTWRQEASIGSLLFPGRFGNYFAQEGWTPLSEFYLRDLRSESGNLFLRYRTLFPFTGEYRHFPDGHEDSSIKMAEGVISWDAARSIAAEALLTLLGLSVSNAEHFEGRQPRFFDLAKVDGRWVFRLNYEGRRRTQPYYVYVVAVATDGSIVSISRRRWPLVPS